MAYSTQTDLEKQLPQARLIQLADDDGDNLADTGVIDEAITKADDEINGYAATRYTVPFSPVPTLVKTLSVDIAIWNLYSRRTIENDTVNKRYERAIQILKDIAGGKVSLGESPGPAEAGAGSPEATQDVSDARVFTKDTLKNF